MPSTVASKHDSKFEYDALLEPSFKGNAPTTTTKTLTLDAFDWLKNKNLSKILCTSAAKESQIKEGHSLNFTPTITHIF